MQDQQNQQQQQLAQFQNQYKEAEQMLKQAELDLKRYEIDSKLEGVKYTADRMLDGRLLDDMGNDGSDQPVVEDNSFEEQLKTREANRKEKMDKHIVSKDNKELTLKAKALSQRKTTTSK